MESTMEDDSPFKRKAKDKHAVYDPICEHPWQVYQHVDFSQPLVKNTKVKPKECRLEGGSNLQATKLNNCKKNKRYLNEADNKFYRKQQKRVYF